DLAPGGEDRRLADAAEGSGGVVASRVVGAHEEDGVLQGACQALSAICLRAVAPAFAEIGREPGGGMDEELSASVDEGADVVGEDVVVADRDRRPHAV